MNDGSDGFLTLCIGAVFSACVAGFLFGDTVTPENFHKAEQICIDSNSSLKEYTQYIFTAKVKCKNEAEFKLKIIE